jgi:predicted amidophosphoribosyltransferase
VLLEQVCERLEVKVRSDLVLRARPTKDQTKLKARQRIKNMQNAFMVEKGMEELIVGNNFIVFDDVKTTGATLNQCAKILKNHGAKSVWGLTLAG